jgi:hypothetical protein
MPLRLWTIGSQGEIIHPTSFVVFPGLPQGVTREDRPDYVLSNTYAKTFGINLPRRDVLLGLASFMVASAVPLRPARAIPLAPVMILAAAIGAATMRIFSPTFGRFDVKNQDDDRVKGYVQIRVLDLKTDEEEGAVNAFYVFPANTNITINFNRGPTATTKGDKTLEVDGDDSSASDDFEAI